ncbi:unnamed protein product [Orchesella dallaii]|uniref:Ionotropic glutamate receptor C-terminal domain-containing protein n=1 Tax=Orchesella dallaii TaxID=48710 RepID=A0ABP1R832_9HEXA
MTCSYRFNNSSKISPFLFNTRLNFSIKFLCAFLVLSSQYSQSVNVSASCFVCCPSLFRSQGVVNIRERTASSHILSYAIRCLFPDEEVVLITDEFNSRPTHINMQRNSRDDARRKCTYPENTPIAYLTTDAFLNSNSGFFLRLSILQTNLPTKVERTNFIFTTNSDAQVLSLIYKIDEELQILTAENKLIWQPSILILWTENQFILRTNPETNFIPGQQRLNSWFQSYKPKFTVDSGIFFFFIVQKGNSTRSKTNLYFSVWEVYNLKEIIVIEELHEKSLVPKQFRAVEDTACGSKNQNVFKWEERVISYMFLDRFRRRSDFRGQKISAAVPENTGSSDWITVKKAENGSALRLQRGFSVNVFRDLQCIMNFREEIVLGSTNQLLVVINETQMPLLAELNSGKADISLNQASVYAERAKVCSFLQPTYSGIYQAFFQQPSANSIRNIVSAPFTAPLWFTLIATWLFLIGCVHSWAIVAKRNQIGSCYRDDRFIQEIGMWTIAATCQKSWYLLPRTFVFKIIFCIGSLMAIVCYVAYSATIVSFLTVKAVPVRTFIELIQYDYKFTVHQYSSGTILLLKEMIESFNLPQTIITTDTQNEITHIINAKNAFLSYPDMFYQTAAEQNYSENFLCSTVNKLPAQNIPYKSSMYVKKGSQYREIFGEKLIVIMERGLNFRYKKDYDTTREVTCVQTRYDEGHGEIDPNDYTTDGKFSI